MIISEQEKNRIRKLHKKHSIVKEQMGIISEDKVCRCMGQTWYGHDGGIMCNTDSGVQAWYASDCCNKTMETPEGCWVSSSVGGPGGPGETEADTVKTINQLGDGGKAIDSLRLNERKKRKPKKKIEDDKYTTWCKEHGWEHGVGEGCVDDALDSKDGNIRSWAIGFMMGDKQC